MNKPQQTLDDLLDRVYRTGGYRLEGTSVAMGKIKQLTPNEAKAAIYALLASEAKYYIGAGLFNEVVEAVPLSKLKQLFGRGE